MVLTNETGYIWTPSTLLGTMVHVVSYFMCNSVGTDGRTDGRTDGQTDGRYQVQYLPPFTVDNYNLTKSIPDPY